MGPHHPPSPGRPPRRAALLAAVAGNLGVLACFKYYRFFTVSATNLLGELGVQISPRILSVTLPVGISFFTFQALSYVIDVYRREIEPVKFLDFALFVSFFPQLVAGPIVRGVGVPAPAPRAPTTPGVSTRAGRSS